MNRHVIAPVCLIASVGLSACGGAGNPFDAAVANPFGPITSAEAALLATAYTTQSDAIMVLPVTPVDEVPNGNATFIGRSQIEVTADRETDVMLLTSDAVLEVDFDTPRVGARMTNFTGATMIGETVRLEGVLAVENGIIDAVDRNTFSGSFAGVLLGNGVDIRASGGSFEGVFRDVPTSAASFSGKDETATYNGDDAEITLTGIAAE